MDRSVRSRTSSTARSMRRPRRRVWPASCRRPSTGSPTPRRRLRPLPACRRRRGRVRRCRGRRRPAATAPLWRRAGCPKPRAGLLGPVLTVRSDTFLVRAYGDAVNPLTGAVGSRAWCEAVVQRVPDYVDPGDPPEAVAGLTETKRSSAGGSGSCYSGGSRPRRCECAYRSAGRKRACARRIFSERRFAASQRTVLPMDHGPDAGSGLPNGNA